MAVYAWADIHGCWDCFQEGLKCLTPNDKVYFLGDAADRGPDGWRIIKEIIKDKRFIYLKGNHEDLLCKVLGNMTPDTYEAEVFLWDNKMDLWFWNGGEPTYTAIMEDKSISVKEILNIIHKLNHLPFCCVYRNKSGQNVFLSHAGCASIEAAETREENDFLWDRTHYHFYNTWDGEDDEFIVHGHTPIEFIIEEQKNNAEWFAERHLDKKVDYPDYNGHGAFWYGQGHKICIDTGATWSGESVLLNLDTWEETVFTFTPSLG